MTEADGLIARAEQEHQFTTRMHGSIADYHIAPGGDGPFAADWKDKPHRLLYDVLGEVQALRATVQQLQQEKDDLQTKLSEAFDSEVHTEHLRQAADTHREALTTAAEVLEQIVAAYDVYRGRGVQPAPDDYQRMAILIDKTARNTLAKLAAHTGRT